MILEGAFGKLKSRFRIFHRKCESSKDSVRAMSLGDILSRSMDLTVDSATNKRRDREEVAAILDLTDRY